MPNTLDMVSKALLGIDGDSLFNGAKNLSRQIDLLAYWRHSGNASQRNRHVEMAPDHARIRLDRLASILLSDLVLLQSLRFPVGRGLRNHVTEINVDSSYLRQRLCVLWVRIENLQKFGKRLLRFKGSIQLVGLLQRPGNRRAIIGAIRATDSASFRYTALGENLHICQQHEKEHQKDNHQ